MMPKPFLIKSQSWISALLLQHKGSRMRRARQTSLRYCSRLFSYFPPPPPASPGETHRQMLWQHVLSLWKFIASDVCLDKKKKLHTRPVTSLKLSFPAFRNDKGERWSSAGTYAFSLLPDVFIRCCRGAKLQINKAISTSHPLTLTREDLLVATAAGAHGDLIISTWLAGYREPHRSMGLILSQGTGATSKGGLEYQGLFPFYMSEAWPFPHVSLTTLQLWKLCCWMAAHC